MIQSNRSNVLGRISIIAILAALISIGLSSNESDHSGLNEQQQHVTYVWQNAGIDSTAGAESRAAISSAVIHATSHSDPTTRRPIDLELVDNDSRLLVLNKQSASLSVVDRENGEVAAEFDLDGEPVDMCIGPNGAIFIVDQKRHRLSQYQLHEDTITLADTIEVARYPTQCAFAPDGQSIFVSSRWSRRLTCIETDDTEDGHSRLVVRELVDLEFSPHQLQFVNRHVDDEAVSTLVVADAFGGRLLMMDPTTLDVIRDFVIPGHNIRGMATTPDHSMLLVSHQMLNELAHTVRNDVHWGLLMSNDLRWLNVDAIFNRPENLFGDSHMHPLGQANHAAGDPNDVCMTENGDVLVAIGGTDEVSIGRESDFSLERIKVGRRPIAVETTLDGETAYVANMFDDSISVINVHDKQVTATIQLGIRAEESLVERGERLFFDARLSHDGWMSCHSCHTDGHSNGLLNDNLTDRDFGAPKRVLSLLGAGDTLPLAWDGSVANLHDQIAFSVKSTMQGGRELQPDQLEAISAFIATLEPPPGIRHAREAVDEAARERGEQLFHSLGCFACHQPPAYTTSDVYNVGLVDEMGRQEFNPPSLRGVSQRDRLFHDNRASSLEALFVEYEHSLTQPLEAQELSDLLEFLKSI